MKTGDIGKLDEDGFLFILDPKKDMIIIPHPKWGERPLALVIRKEGSSISEKELVDWVNPNPPLTQVRINESIMIHQAIPLDLSHFLSFYSIDLIPEVTRMKKEPRSARSRLESERTEGDMEWVEGRATIQRIDDFS